MPRHRKIEVYRDGKVHVLKRQCSTCILWTDERAAVEPQRAEAMVARCERENTVVPCHEWMDTKTPVVCRGLYQTRRVAMLQIAERLGAIQFDDLGDGPDFRRKP